MWCSLIFRELLWSTSMETPRETALEWINRCRERTRLSSAVTEPRPQPKTLIKCIKVLSLSCELPTEGWSRQKARSLATSNRRTSWSLFLVWDLARWEGKARWINFHLSLEKFKSSRLHFDASSDWERLRLRDLRVFSSSLAIFFSLFLRTFFLFFLSFWHVISVLWQLKLC